MHIVPAALVRLLIPRRALDGSRRRGCGSAGWGAGGCRSGSTRAAGAGGGELVTREPAPVGDVAVGAPGRAGAIAIVGAVGSVGLAEGEVAGRQAELIMAESGDVDHGGHGCEREGGGPGGDEEAIA